MRLWNLIDSFFTESAIARQHSPIRKIVLFLLFFVLNTVLLSIDFLPDKVSLSLGQVSDRDVVAPRTVSFVDEPRTRKLETEVVASVANVYDLDIQFHVLDKDYEVKKNAKQRKSQHTKR